MKFHGVHWTEPLERRLWELATSPQQPTYDQIAHTLGLEFGVRLTKNSCIGRARRMGVPVRIAPRFRSNYRDAVIFTVDPRKARPKPRYAVPERRYDHVSIYDLGANDCRWPFGDRPPFQFCGREVVDGHPYCAEHVRKSYPPRKT